ncbi:MAG TPA: methyltransferase domain-containing protein [Candidatus Elarobacter sp.]
MNELFFALHDGLPREGPGDDALTVRAFRGLGSLPPRPALLDVGCGPGAQTVTLASLGADVVAVDVHEPFLRETERRAGERGVADRVRTVRASMTDLPFGDGAFDVVWSEGAIYLMGFGAGLRAWRRVLRPGGAIAVSELTWIARDPPAEAKRFWDAAYPAMTTVEANRRALAESGYTPLAELVFPVTAWFANYYDPLERRIAMLRERHAREPDAQAWLDEQQAEIDLARRCGDAYAYVFYLGRRD